MLFADAEADAAGAVLEAALGAAADEAVLACASFPEAELEDCWTTTQLPKPPAVVNEARHLSFDAPPEHLVPEGSWITSCWEPVPLGFYRPKKVR